MLFNPHSVSIGHPPRGLSYCVSICFSQGGSGHPPPTPKHTLLPAYQHLLDVPPVVGETSSTWPGYILTRGMGLYLDQCPQMLSTLAHPALTDFHLSPFTHVLCPRMPSSPTKSLPSSAASECPSETSVTSLISIFRFKRSSHGKTPQLFRHHCISVSYPPKRHACNLFS